MNNLSNLFRRSQTIIPERKHKKYGNVNIQQRKQLRRFKSINYYSRQFTGQTNQHGWFTPKRFKALGNYLENCRNTHLGFLPIDNKLAKEIGDVFVEDAHWSYFNYRNYHSQILLQNQILKQTVTEAQLSQLPTHFQTAIQKSVETQQPKNCNSIFLYNEQFNIFMPQDERYRFNLKLKLLNPPVEKSNEDK